MASGIRTDCSLQTPFLRLRETQVYGCKHKYLGGYLTKWPLSKITVAGTTMGPLTSTMGFWLGLQNQTGSFLPQSESQIKPGGRCYLVTIRPLFHWWVYLVLQVCRYYSMQGPELVKAITSFLPSSLHSISQYHGRCSPRKNILLRMTVLCSQRSWCL